ncbi:MAG: hypothetical protein QXN55_00140 [Candidatus Nitrosotenuis sp.]
MKVGVVKLGARISFSSIGTSGGTGEAISIIKMLQLGGADVHIYTKILKKDVLLPEYTFHDILTSDLSMSEMDALIVINGTVNYFGGADAPDQTLNYVAINKFAGPVFYIYCDPELTLKHLWPNIAKRDWGKNYSEKDINIVRDDIIYVSQPYLVDVIFEDIKKEKGAVIPKKVIHYPFERFPCLNDRLEINPSPVVDLMYGGTMRGGRRAKKMAQFYFGYPDDILVEMFGKIEAEDFKGKAAAYIDGLTHPKFTGPVNYDRMLNKMNTAMCHVVIGDPYYEETQDMAQRAYESIWAGNIVFIDKDLDTIKRTFPKSEFLQEWAYVENRDDVIERIQLLKETPNLREEILEMQISGIEFVAQKYCDDFVKLLETNING